MHILTNVVFIQFSNTLNFTILLFINFRDNATFYWLYQHGTGPIHICNVQCNGTETDLTECWQYPDRYYKYYCFHYYDICVKCDSGKTSNSIFNPTKYF